MRLEGKVALITGTSTNIGGGIAEGLALSRVKHSWRAEWARAELDVAF